MAMLVSEIMSNCAECAEDTPVERVYELIQECGQGFVVVIDSESHRVPLGLVTEHSICEQIIAKGRKMRGLTAGGVLDSRIRKVPETAPAADCAKFLAGSLPAAVIAVDAKGGLRGFVPPDAIASRPVAAAAEGRDAAQNPGEKKFSGAIEIPAFGWVQ